MEMKQVFQQYGDVIVKQKIMPVKQDKSAITEKKYFIAQERLTLAEPSDVFNYNNESISERIRVQIEALIAVLKTSFIAYRQTNTYDLLPLDLGPGNLLVTTDEEVKYVDTTEGVPNYQVLDQAETAVYEIFNRIAELELIIGQSPEALLEDDFYTDLWQHVSSETGVDLHDSSSSEEFRRVLQQHWKTHPFRQHQNK